MLRYYVHIFPLFRSAVLRQEKAHPMIGDKINYCWIIVKIPNLPSSLEDYEHRSHRMIGFGQQKLVITAILKGFTSLWGDSGPVFTESNAACLCVVTLQNQKRGQPQASDDKRQ
jgi:hypothetical protein